MSNRYNISLGANLDRALNELAEREGISKSEVIRQALLLYKHAVAADEVLLKSTSNGQEMMKQILLR